MERNGTTLPFLPFYYVKHNWYTSATFRFKFVFAVHYIQHILIENKVCILYRTFPVFVKGNEWYEDTSITSQNICDTF
jgi:hypothetical protein